MRFSPGSPVGRALLGRGLGDDVNVQTPQGLREYSVLDVR
jgi:transcription elongation GreA/GreB family factor